MSYRKLSVEEVSVLESGGCTADNWDRIYVAPGFKADRIRRTSFYGTVHIGSLDGVVSLPGDAVVPCGICDARLRDVSVGDGVYISGVHGYISCYDIGDHVRIINVGTIYMDGSSSFGNGMDVNVINETGGRSVTVFKGMTAQWAYMAAMYRHSCRLESSLRAAAMTVADRERSCRGRIGRCSVIENLGSVVNVRVGDSALLHGCLRLSEGTVGDMAEIGEGVTASGFIIEDGATVTDGVMMTRVFAGNGTVLSKGFSCADSMFFANSHCENGEAVSVFAGPFTVSHHKSTLLIGSMYSFMNAGSGTNFSNHMYKSGPVHQGIFARGTKFGSGSYMMLPVRTGAFTTVIGHHKAHIDNTELPFSYIVETSGGSRLIPGINLRSYGLFRDMRKWPARDSRRPSERNDIVMCGIFSPYTASAMMSGKRLLAGMSAGLTEGTISYGGCIITVQSALAGMRLYDAALKYYMGKVLLAGLRKQGTMQPEVRKVCYGDWVDMAGLQAPKGEIDALVRDIEEGRADGARDILARFSAMEEISCNREWEWVCGHFEEVFGISLQNLSVDAGRLIEQWAESARFLLDGIEKDIRKEFSDAFMTGYGMDYGKDAAMEDFGRVRGYPEDNAALKAVMDAKADTEREVSEFRRLLL
ncbi:MAG TPA: DUF4954 family protein [Candidatus Coprenecus pullistercoris]|nr:DUF4954 family protein [Candidatus Coprenecus pullistercoris]